VYEELLNVPLFVRLPGQTDAHRIDDAVGLVDIAPTVLEILGRPVPEHLAGRSLVPLLAATDVDAPRATVSGFMDGWRTIVLERYKLIQRTEDHFTLHDLERDPGERTDIAASHPLVVRYLRGQLGLALDGSTREAHTLASSTSPEAARRPPRVRHDAQTTEIDAETEAQLRALGYVGSSRR
jgi:arylsulfatase A-like enzyme